MKPPIAAVLICSFLTGCDGRGVLLYVKPPTASKPPWSVRSVVIPVEEPVDVICIVSKVAADLGMKPASGPNHWSIATPPTGNFELLVQKDAGGYWTVVLRDWPSVQRSEPSREAEAQIRAALKKPSKAPEPTARPVTIPSEPGPALVGDVALNSTLTNANFLQCRLK